MLKDSFTHWRIVGRFDNLSDELRKEKYESVLTYIAWKVYNNHKNCTKEAFSAIKKYSF